MRNYWTTWPTRSGHEQKALTGRSKNSRPTIGLIPFDYLEAGGRLSLTDSVEGMEVLTLAPRCTINVGRRIPRPVLPTPHKQPGSQSVNSTVTNAISKRSQ
jgi:hypothetical protein